ncbi:MAG: hypothetical protein KBB38_05730, partial [Bacteroidia bacterium]|nr:hypothetical protein [Bacteroidia bacterium]
MSKGGYPDFLLVGAARAGTTAVDRYLRQHPEVFLPRVKEPCFFAFAGGTTGYRKGKFSFAVTDREAYQALYKDVFCDDTAEVLVVANTNEELKKDTIVIIPLFDNIVT